MGKTKSKAIRKFAEELLKQGIEFSEDFEENKKILGKTMPSKKMRNKIAGYLCKLMKKQKKRD